MARNIVRNKSWMIQMVGEEGGFLMEVGWVARCLKVREKIPGDALF
jgi:hypothetical protein